MNNLTKYAPQMRGLLRIVTALLFLEHGTQKLLHFPAMAMPAGAPPGGGEMPSYMATMFLIGGILELVGGAAVLLGLFTRPVAFILAGECAVIFWIMDVPMGGTFPILSGGESAVLFCFTFLYLVFAGPGAFAIDNLLGRKTAAA